MEIAVYLFYLGNVKILKIYGSWKKNMGDQKRVSKLDSLSQEQRAQLVKKLHQLQNGLCYICQEIINFQVHKTDIDHIKAIARSGLDDESNWALSHDRCNRSKGTKDLHLQRILQEFRRHVEKYTSANSKEKEKNFTLHQALEELRPKRQEVGVEIKEDQISVSWTENGDPKSEKFILLEETSKPMIRSFIGMISFHCIHHDHEINPRSIVDLEPMIEEFYNGYPQLQPSLGTLTIEGTNGKSKILLFDGQHKAAAQLYARKDRVLVRVFINSDKDRLKETNYRAHTKLAQVHFPQLINDRVGADLFRDEYVRFLQKVDPQKMSEEYFFSKYLPSAQGQGKEYKKYFGNFLRYEILIGQVGSQQNMILNFTETVMPRSIRYPLSYDALQKTFLDVMLFQKPAKEPIDQTENYRKIEKESLVKIMNIFVDEILANGRFDISIGIRRMEERLSEDPQSIPDSHLRAYRICRRSAMAIWIKELKRAIRILLNTKTRYKMGDWSEKRPLWVEIFDEDWNQIRTMIRALRDHKIWGERTNPDIITAVSSTKQKDWENILLKGILPGRQEQLFPSLDQNYMFSRVSGG